MAMLSVNGSGHQLRQLEIRRHDWVGEILVANPSHGSLEDSGKLH